MSQSKLDQIREAAESSLELFIKLVHPQRVLGSCHIELIDWWTRSEAKDHQLVLLPRDHGKSAMIAYRVAWEITKNPAVRILYISSTANLAEKQLGFIKSILDSQIYRRYWPDMLHPEEGKREKWTNSEICVDHPLRKAEAIRDPTVFTGGLTTGLTGLHCDIAVLDDVVVKENAYTEEGREKVRAQYSLLASIEGAEAREWVVGTRYFPADLYNDMLTMKVEEYDSNGEITLEDHLYEIFERQVEDIGDGSGQFLWPRQQRTDGKWFGFDQKILAQKRAKYLDKTQFRAQYYNDPNDAESAPINRDLFQYYNKALIQRQNGAVFYNGRRLNVFASVDFAYSLSKKADYTAIVVVGVDSFNNYYVLDIERFKTDKIKEYFDHILSLHQKWFFRKIRAEITAAQAIIVKELKDNYIRQWGLALTVDEHRPSRHMGTKEERMQAALNPRYENQQVYHYKGGNCDILEEELVLQNPAHDDVKDCLASCFEICVAPSGMSGLSKTKPWEGRTHTRFGGMS
jgi:phage terminase large subunit-like protein